MCPILNFTDCRLWRFKLLKKLILMTYKTYVNRKIRVKYSYYIIVADHNIINYVLEKTVNRKAFNIRETKYRKRSGFNFIFSVVLVYLYLCILIQIYTMLVRPIYVFFFHSFRWKFIGLDKTRDCGQDSGHGYIP